MDHLICSDRVAAAGDPLRADCQRCKALCCTLLPFDADQGFGFDKAAGVPCSNLAADFSCRIHATLVPRGFSGCSSYDCHGAGQYVSALLVLGDNWYESEVLLRETYDLFSATRALHARMKTRRAQTACPLPSAGRENSGGRC